MRFITAMVCVLVLACSANANTARYKLASLASPTDTYISQASAINDHGQVVGISFDYGAFIWDAQSGMRSLKSIAGGPNLGYGYAINENGQVAGQGADGGYLWDPTTGRTSLGGDAAYGINGRGQVVVMDYRHGAFLWEAAASFGTYIPGMQYPYAINDAGQVVGQGNYSAILWSADKGTKILAGMGAARAINKTGDIAGSDGNTYIYNAQACLWRNGTEIQGLGFLPGCLNSDAYGINDCGQVVGYSDYNYVSAFSSHAFVWDSHSGMLDLNNLVDSSGNGWTLQYATDINNHGQIVGYGLDPSGTTKAFLLTPVPEPSSLLTLVCGVGTLGRVALRRKRLQMPKLESCIE